MFLFNVKEIEMDTSKNEILSKKIEIDENLNCFIVISSNNKKILTPLLNKIVDYILDNVSSKDTYNKFSVTLESINFFIKNIRKKEDNINDLSIIIGILEKNNFHFSKVGEASAYLINRNKEFLEISDPSNKIQEFDFISSGKLIRNEKIILSNKRLSDYLTPSDQEDLSKLDNIEQINENIINIFNDEKIQDNVKVLSFDFNMEGEIQDKKIYIERTKNLFYQVFDNDFSKKTIAYFLLLKEKIEKRGKITKNIVFVFGILISVFLLYSILSSIIGKTIEGGKTNEYKTYLIQAREYLRIANENIANPENFDINIKKSEELVAKVKEKNLFLQDVNSIVDDISIIKKQFNGIESLDTGANNLLFKGDFSDGVKLLELDKKLYAVGKSSIYGPIIQGQDIKTNVFEELEIDDEFIDSAVAGTDIILVTKKGRVVNFGKDGKFKYVNVLGQKTWTESNFLETYNGNLYISNKESNQVFMHAPAQSGYNAGVAYLNEGDTNSIGKILAIGIDGGIYMLKNDLTLVKFFRSPKYRLESIVLNKLPKNYTIENQNSSIKIFTRPNLSYVYLLLNNKIWIFEPNTKISSDTKSLTYLGQIEGKNEPIISFNVPRDNEAEIMTKSGIYKLAFEIKEGKLIVR